MSFKEEDITNFYYLDLFAGIGSFALGAYWAGWKFEKHYYSEIDEYCCNLYQLRFPDAIPLGDIRKIDFNKLPRGNWIITGGFPCQDISIAGKGVGIEGERSSLWFEMWKIIRILRPKYTIIENVGAITFRGLDRVLESLAEIGYDAEWQDIRASDVGAPHKRERIWIVAYPRCKHGKKRNKVKRIVQGMPEDRETCNQSKRSIEMDSNPSGFRCNSWEYNRRKGQILYNENRDNKKNQQEGKEWQLEFREMGTILSYSKCKRQYEKYISKERQTPRHIGWETEPRVGRMAHGLPHQVDRLRALGNAIVPQIAMLLFSLIKDKIREEKGAYEF